MLIFSLTGNRIRCTPVFRLLYQLYYYTQIKRDCKRFFISFRKKIADNPYRFISLPPTLTFSK